VTQFLIEAVVLSVFRRAIGISLALAASFAVARALGLHPFALDYGIVALAFAFSAPSGSCSGSFRHDAPPVSINRRAPS
jgi:hypothetical protein